MSAVYPALCLWHLGMVSKHLPVLLVAVILGAAAGHPSDLECWRDTAPGAGIVRQ